MPVQNQITLDWNKSVQLNELNSPDKSAAIFDQSGGHNLLDYLITQNAPSRQTMGRDGAFEVPVIGDNSRVAEVLSTVAISSTELRVNFVDVNYDKFRVTEVITDGSAAQFKGRVKSKGAGFVILSPAPPITAWDTGVHFLAGSFATDIAIATPNRSISGVESIYNIPKYAQFQTSVQRESVQIFRNDLQQMYVDESGYFILSQIEEMTRRFANQLENKALWSEFGQTVEADGTVNYSEGFYPAVKKPETGGVYRPMGNIPTEADFIDFASDIADRRNDAKTKLSFLMGRKALQNIQSFPSIRDQVINAGSNNTFGGVEVKGGDVYKYAIAGIEMEFMLLPSLNNTYKWVTPSALTTSGTRMQHTIICPDFNYRATDRSEMVPAVEKVYFGPSEVEVGCIEGITGNFGAAGQAGLSGGKPSNASDATSIEMYSNCAYRWLPYYGGLMELAL